MSASLITQLHNDHITMLAFVYFCTRRQRNRKYIIELRLKTGRSTFSRKTQTVLTSNKAVTRNEIYMYNIREFYPHVNPGI